MVKVEVLYAFLHELDYVFSGVLFELRPLRWVVIPAIHLNKSIVTVGASRKTDWDPERLIVDLLSISNGGCPRVPKEYIYRAILKDYYKFVSILALLAGLEPFYDGHLLAILDLVFVIVLDDDSLLDQFWVETKDNPSICSHQQFDLRLILAPDLVIALTRG